MTVADALRAASQRLSETSDTARLDAELLMAHALDVSRSDMLLRHMDEAEPAGFAALIDRRATSEPVAYIMGYAEFYGRRFDVGPGVLIPRDDSETVIAAAFKAQSNPKRVLDMGVGSGALLLTILRECPKACGIGMDRSPIAVATAQRNAQSLAAESRAQFLSCDWNEPRWADDLGQFDLILCNPPYVERDAELAPDVRDFEPAEALFAGDDGLDDYRILIPQLQRLLTHDGTAILEIGHTQAEAVQEMAEKQGFVSRVHHDLGNRPRCLTLQQVK